MLLYGLFVFIVDRDTCIFEIFGMLTFYVSVLTSYFKCENSLHKSDNEN